MPRRRDKFYGEATKDALKDLSDLEALEIVQNNYALAKENRSEKETEWKESWRLFKAELPTETKARRKADKKPCLVPPKVYSNIKSASSRVYKSVITTRPYVRTFTTEEEFFDATETINSLIDYQIDKTKIIDWLLTLTDGGLIFGEIPVKVIWHFATDTFMRHLPMTRTILDEAGNPVLEGGNPMMEYITNPKTGERIYEPQKVQKITYNSPIVIPLDKDEYYFDPTAKRDKKVGWRLHRSIQALAKLQRLASIEDSNFHNIDKIKDMDCISTTEGRDFLNINNPEGIKDETVKKVLVWERWSKNRMITTVGENGGSVCILNIANPHWELKDPFLTFRPIPTIFTRFGDAFPQISKQTTSERNAIRNQRVEAINRHLNEMWKVDTNAEIDTSTLVSRQGGVVRIDDMDGVEQFKFQPIDPSTWTEESILDKDDMDSLGITPLTKGQPVFSRETARTTLSLIDEANIRFSIMILMMRSFMIDLANAFLQLSRQYITRPITVPHYETGRPITIYPEMLNGDYTFKCQAVDYSIFLSIFDRIIDIPTVKQKPLLKTLFQMAQIPNADKYLKTDEELQQEQQMQMQQQMQMEMMGQRGGMQGGQA